MRSVLRRLQRPPSNSISLNAERNTNLDTILESAAFAGFLVAQFLAVVVTHAARFDDVATNRATPPPRRADCETKLSSDPTMYLQKTDLAN